MQVNSTTASNAAIQNQVGKKTTEKSESSEKDTSKNRTDTESANIQSAKTSSLIKDKETLQKLSNLGGKGITQMFFMQFQQQSFNAVFGNSTAQAGILDLLNNPSASKSTSKIANIFSQIDFASIGYAGKNPLSMNQQELTDLLGENGFFGVENTANRIADFVITGAGDDLEKLKKGFEGMKQGFEQAEKIWGSKLPQISQDTIDKAIEKVSAKIKELGGNAVDLNA